MRARLGKPGTECMPPLNEGTLLYMPTTLPGLSVSLFGLPQEAETGVIAAVPQAA